MPNIRPHPVKLELRKSQDYRGECELEGTTAPLGQQPVFHQSLPPQEADHYMQEYVKKDPDKTRNEERGDNMPLPGGANLVTGVITESAVTPN